MPDDNAPRWHPGGLIPGGPELIRLEAGEELIGRHGRRRARVICGRLVRWPLWLAKLPPWYPYWPRKDPRG